ncbi:MAG: hypothetical protein ACFE0Q_08905 [Anaerolineae bacterium]
MAFQQALTHLATISVTGITRQYGINEIPETLHRAQLPALLVMPIDTQSNALFQESGGAFEAVAFSGGAQTVRYVLTHLLVIAPVTQGKGLREHLPTLISAIDHYIEALGADVTLGDHLVYPAQIQIEPGIYSVGNRDYIGCAFRHRWIVAV